MCVVAHLRAVKDPFLAARAVRYLPLESRIRVVHCGRALEPEFEAEARRESTTNPRYRWVGDLARCDALRLIAASRALLVTSRTEGGANVVSEALANDTPVLSTRIAGSIGILGADHPGYFEIGDAGGLAARLEQLERDPRFRDELQRAGAVRKPLVDPALERAAWASLLTELT